MPEPEPDGHAPDAPGGFVASEARAVAIVNERSGGGATLDAFRRAEGRLAALLGELDVRFTDGPGHASALAREALAGGADAILVAGGDGTLHEVVNGWFADDGTPHGAGAVLGLLPGGTGGDFRRTVRVPDPDAAIAAIAAGRVIRADVARAEMVDDRPGPTQGQRITRRFLNILSVGLGGRTVRLVHHYHAFGGPLAYALSTIHGLWGWTNPALELVVDGEVVALEPAVVAIANGRFFGGGMKIAPDAALDDGQLQVVALDRYSKLDVLLLARTLYDGGHVYDPRVVVRAGRDIRLRPVGADAARDVLLDLDGEAVGQLPLHVQVEAGAIPLLVRG